MEERNLQQRITQHLQNVEVQQRILQDMQRAREEATVTISDAANLFDLTDARLRDWEKNGLLNPQRRVQDTEQDGKGAKRRQYTTTELDKLAIIRELIQQGKFSPGVIPINIDEIWASIVSEKQQKSSIPEIGNRDTEHIHIDQRIERTEKEEFWRYFVSQALRLSLLLICEDVPDTVAGIILPLEQENVAEIVQNSDDLPKAGYSLVGWLSESRSFYMFLEGKPSFEHPSDFRVESLKKLASEYARVQAPENNILIIVQRKAKSLILGKEVVATVQRLLGLVYETSKQWRAGFENGRRDWMYQVTDFTVSSAVSDEVLNGLADIVVQLGEKMEDGRERWRFCCIALPEDTSFPVQQRELVVRAQSEFAPHKFAAVSAAVPGLSFRAYQSGQVIYRPNLSSKDYMIAYQDREEFTHSAIAIPLVSEDGLAIGVMYLASDKLQAFSDDDQRVLRVVGRMIEELLMTYRTRQLDVGNLTDIIVSPTTVDTSFKDFFSESDFVADLEEVLKCINKDGVVHGLIGEELSIIAVDVDDLASVATKYGDSVARNLSQAVGEKIKNQPGLFTNTNYRKLYHVGSDTFYLIMKGESLESARNNAKLLKDSLGKEHRVDALRVSSRRAILPGMLLTIKNTVRLGVHTYKYEKLKELLGRYHSEYTEAAVIEVLANNLDNVLLIGQERGGDVIISWDNEKWGFIEI